MDPFTHLEYALFQLTPTRTRCDLLLFSGKNKEKLASGLVEPFISHLKFFKDQISKGGYSITLRPPTTNAFWFTKSTFQRLVRFINSPEVLERFIRLEREILQIENSVHNNDSEEHAGEAGSLSSDGSTKKSTDPSKINTGEAGDNVQEETSKIQLQRLLETRKAMLRKEQAMAYHRALVAGFETENMNDLILFADQFGASRLREACIEFKDLCKKKHNDGLWMDELAAMAAYPPSELAYTGTSGLLIATESNASTLNNDLNYDQMNSDGDKNNTDQAPSTPSNVQMQMPWPNQMPQYMYNFAGPQGPRYPYPYPGMPPYYPHHMNWPANADDSGHGRHHRSSSKKKSKSPLPDSSEDEEDDDSNEDGESDSVSDSGTVSKSTKRNKKKSSKTVVIRNINYITSNRKNSDGGSDDSAEDEVDGVLETLAKHHNKSSKSHEKKKKGADVENESGKQSQNWDAFQNLLLKDDVQDDHFSIRNDAMDVGSENYVRNQPKVKSNDSFVVPDRNGFDESRRVNSQDFENGETFRMKGRDSSDADMVISHRFGSGTNGMTNYQDLGSESSMIRNKRDGDWFVVKNSDSQTEKSTFDYVSMKGDVFSSETNKKNEPIDDSFMVQPQTTVPYDSQWRSTDVSMVENINKPDTDDSNQVAKTGFYEPDDLYLMVTRDSGVEPPVRSSWTPEIDYGSEAQFTKSEPKPAPVETKDQTEESPVKAKTKKVVKPKPLSRSLPTDKRLPFVNRSVVHKSKREQEDEIRKRVEELAAERQRRIAERTAAAASGSTKKPVNQKGPLKKTVSKVTGA